MLPDCIRFGHVAVFRMLDVGSARFAPLAFAVEIVTLAFPANGYDQVFTAIEEFRLAFPHGLSLVHEGPIGFDFVFFRRSGISRERIVVAQSGVVLLLFEEDVS